jgi:hypothetical protein
MREVLLACAALLQRFELTIRNPSEVKPKMVATLRTVDGLKVRAEKRKF